MRSAQPFISATICGTPTAGRSRSRRSASPAPRPPRPCGRARPASSGAQMKTVGDRDISRVAEQEDEARRGVGRGPASVPGVMQIGPAREVDLGHPRVEPMQVVELDDLRSGVPYLRWNRCEIITSSQVRPLLVWVTTIASGAAAARRSSAAAAAPGTRRRAARRAGSSRGLPAGCCGVPIARLRAARCSCASMLMVSVLRIAPLPLPCIGRTECQELKVLTKITAWLGVKSKVSITSISSNSALRSSS